MIDPEPARVFAPSSRTRLLGFRFACLYWVLYLCPFPLDLLGRYAEPVTDAYRSLWFALVPWVGRHVLHLPEAITVFPNGSGDTTFNYVQILCYATIALAGAAAWTLTSRASDDSRPRAFLRVYLRYALAFIMLSYGMAKLTKNQFPDLGPERLLTPLGEASPMGLLWTFMGYSTPYTVFAGALEFVGGLFLLFRRTTPLGSVILVGVMTNVVMLNVCYDVPVKLYSSHLLAIAVLLMLPDVPRVLNVLAFNKPADERPLGPDWSPRARMPATVAKVIFIGAMAASLTLETLRDDSDEFAPPATAGLYEIESFQPNGRAENDPAQETDWRWLVVTNFGRLSIHARDNSVRRFWLEEDPEKSTLTLRSHPAIETPDGVLQFERVDPNTLLLQGTLQEAGIVARLRKVQNPSFPLMERGFHWINEIPLNR